MAFQRIQNNDLLLTNQFVYNRSQISKPRTDSTNYVSENSSSATQIHTFFSSKSLSIEFTSADGDSVSLSYEAHTIQGSIRALQTESDPEKIKEIAQYLKNEFISMKNELFKTLSGNDNATEPEKVQKKPLEIPEYWNAENTSQRIVDFAVSFYELVDVKGEAYFSKIKNAIEEGFKQAKGLLGELSEEVEKLVKDTYDKTMSKLDVWAVGNRIPVESA